MMGYCDNKEQIYKNADLLLMTSSTEGFGLVIIEAMYYGVPCIAFDCPVSPKEVIADSGITIPCFDEDAYAQKLLRSLKIQTLFRFYRKNLLNEQSRST